MKTSIKMEKTKIKDKEVRKQKMKDVETENTSHKNKKTRDTVIHTKTRHFLQLDNLGRRKSRRTENWKVEYKRNNRKRDSSF